MFDMEKEAERLDGWLFEHSTLEQEGCMKFNQLVSEALTRAHEAGRDAAEEADIKAVCWRCEKEFYLGRRPRGDGWWHGTDRCIASLIHERRREREEPTI